MGRSLRRDIASMNGRVKVLPTVLTPMMAVGLVDSMQATKSRLGGRGGRVGLLEVEQVVAAWLKQAVDVEHRDPRLRVLERQPFPHHGGGDQSGQANRGRTGAEKEDAEVANFPARDLEGGDQAGERHAA